MKLKIAIIGAGKIAYSIASALCKINLTPKIILSRKISSAKNLAEKFNIKYYSKDYSFLIDKNIEPDFFILSVPDSEIENTSNELSKLNLDFPQKYFIHLSGATNISALNVLKKKNANIGSFHIMQTFPSKNVIDIKNCYVGIESSNKKTEKLLFDLAKKLKLNPFKINSKDKVYYHLAGVYASNFLINNFFQSQFFFKKSNIKKENFRDVMFPIINTTFENVKKNNITNSLSGPIERGDVDTILNHISVIKKLRNENSETNFLLLSYLTHSLQLIQAIKMKRKKLNINQKTIEKLLNNELRKIKIF
ncbi:MAG: hypothetical protein STSR0008_21630 [Ignavibacterium sp.]